MKQSTLICTFLLNYISGFPAWISVILFVLVLFMDIPGLIIREHHKTKRAKIRCKSKKKTNKKFSKASCGQLKK